jgi:hypothetical protein
MPWGRLDDSLYDHPKLDLIPVEQRLAALGLWARAISWCNRFLTDGHVPRGRIERLDGTLALAGLLVGAGLFDDVPTGYEVHDFLEFNDSRADVLDRREKEAQRQRDWRKKKADARNGVTPNGSEPEVTPVVTGVVTPSVTPVVTGFPARASRSANPGPARPGPDSLKRGSSRGRAARADVAAWHDRGWKRVTKAQRAVLDEILARHDVTGPEFAAEAIRATPDGADPLEAVMTADRLWQDAQRRRADAEEAAWAKTKADEREPSKLGDVLRKASAAPTTTPDEPDWMTVGVGGVESSEASAGQGPRGSRVPGATGSNVEGPTS